MHDAAEEQHFPALTSLTKAQRRVLGVLIEKGLTTPEVYPLTIKALTSGCNQKSNRDPVTNYSEEDSRQALDELRELGLAAVVHTDTGRTERFRHYVRKRWPVSEPQVAILAELWLRGRQSLGDLRVRAGRMVPIETLDDLRTALEGLRALGLIQSDAPLERRGAEVDHSLYEPREGKTMSPREFAGDEGSPAMHSATAARGDSLVPEHSDLPSDRRAGETLADLRTRQHELESSMSELREQIAALRAEVQGLRTSLGG